MGTFEPFIDNRPSIMDINIGESSKKGDRFQIKYKGRVIAQFILKDDETCAIGGQLELIKTVW